MVGQSELGKVRSHVYQQREKVGGGQQTQLEQTVEVSSQ